LLDEKIKLLVKQVFEDEKQSKIEKNNLKK
jgi:hypothetical protein